MARLVTPPRTVYLPPRFPWQDEVLAAKERFRVVAAARQIGKSFLATLECIGTAAPGGTVWWVAPVYQMAAQGYATLERICADLPGVNHRRADRMFEFPGGGTIQIKTAEDPNNLRGTTLDLAVMDEFAFMNPDAWYSAVWSTLSVRKGRALFLSSPWGKNHLYDLWRLGDPENPDKLQDWRSWRFDQRANPLITQDDIEAARQVLPHRKFEREIMASFADAGGEVFSNIRLMAIAPDLSNAAANPDHHYVMGVDWGSVQDYTVVIVLDITTNEQVAMYRFNNTSMRVATSDNPFEAQYDQIEQIQQKWQADVILVELNSIGRVNFEFLKARRLPVKGFDTTSVSKRPLIEGWVMALEMGQCHALNHPDMIREHEAYEVIQTETGLLKYGAPKGQTDDTVVASALAWHAAHGMKRNLGANLMGYTGLWNKSNPAVSRRTNRRKERGWWKVG